MLAHRSVSPVPIYAPGWRETKWSKVPCLRKQRNGQGLNPWLPDPEFEVLTAQPHTPPLIRIDNTVVLIISSPNRKRKALPQILALRRQTKRTIPKTHEPGPLPKPVKTLLPWGEKARGIFPKPPRPLLTSKGLETLDWTMKQSIHRWLCITTSSLA